MKESDFLLEQEVTIKVNGIEAKFLIANFHNPRYVMDAICAGLNNFQGVRKVQA